MNGISCVTYSAGEKFSAELIDTTQTAILKINPAKLTVTMDDGSAVEEYTTYGRLFSVKQFVSEKRFIVEFERVSATEKLAEELGSFIEGLKEVIGNGE